MFNARLLMTIAFFAATGCSHLSGHEGDITYTCASGERSVASYPSPETAVLAYRGETHRLQRVRSASGARYADDTIVWWIKGSEASLFSIEQDGSTGKRLDVCRVASGA
ncbi:MAG: MliC family protein [Gammaproteobacteria bacterium]